MSMHQVPHSIRGEGGESIFREKAKQRDDQVSPEEQRAKGLGWFSVGLGLAEVLTPGHLGKAIGVKNHKTLMRMMGLREITSGIGIVSGRRPANWVWSRVAGDILDLGFLFGALTSNRTRKGRVVAATAAVAGVTALDILTASQLSSITGKAGKSVIVRRTLTINKSPEELYRFWHDFQNLPRFMQNLESVRVFDQRRSHWIAIGPGDIRIEWDAEIIADTPNEVIAWKSTADSEFKNAGSVQFQKAPGGRGTRVFVEMQYTPPAGALGATIAKFMGKDPAWQVQENLRRFKQLMETGEIATTEGQPSGQRGMITRFLKKQIH